MNVYGLVVAAFFIAGTVGSIAAACGLAKQADRALAELEDGWSE